MIDSKEIVLRDRESVDNNEGEVPIIFKITFKTKHTPFS